MTLAQEKAVDDAKFLYEKNLVIGFIEGFTSNFNKECEAGLVESITYGFYMLDTYQVWLPKNMAKFNIANNGLIESSNIVYAYCDMSVLAEKLSIYTYFSDPEVFVVVGARIAGAMINTVPELVGCISEGKVEEDGWKVGNCFATLVSTILDVKL